MDVPADADLTEHFLVFETISHRWASVSVSAPVVKATPKLRSRQVLTDAGIRIGVLDVGVQEPPFRACCYQLVIHILRDIVILVKRTA